MALALVDSLDGISAELAKEYEEIKDGDHTGKFRLKVETVGGLVLENVTGLKTALATEKEAVRQKSVELATLKTRYEGLDDPDAARDALAKVAAGTTGKADTEAAVASALKQAEEKHQIELKTAGDRSSVLSDEIERLLVDAELTKSIVRHGGGKNVELLLPHGRTLVKVEETQADGVSRFVSRVKNPDGGTRITMQTGSTDPMGIDELVETDLKTQFPSAFNGSGASGGGGSGSDRGDGGGGGEDISNLSPLEKLKRARAKQAS